MIKMEDLYLVQDYIKANQDMPIQKVYVELKNKNKKDMSKAEKLVFTYLKLNKRKLGLK